VGGRAVKVGTSHRIPALNMAERNVAAKAEKPSNALSARPVLRRAACVLMVHMDELPLLKRRVAHGASTVLRLQQLVELLLS
jgi:hypothetical protein